MPLLFANVRFRQTSQSVLPVEFWYLPSEHDVHDEDPGLAEELPGAQGSHCETAMRPVAPADVPAGQVLQSVLPGESWYLPWGQGSHVSDSILSRNFPNEQFAQLVICHSCPSGHALQ